MYHLHLTNQYRKSYKKSANRRDFDLEVLNEIIDTLRNGRDLPVSYRNHKLNGKLDEFFECHLGYDIVLVYRRSISDNVLTFDYIGPHTDIF